MITEGNEKREVVFLKKPCTSRPSSNKSKKMGVLVRKMNTKEITFTGIMVGQWFNNLISEAAKKGYSGCKLEWFDPCDGWTSMSCNFENDTIIPTEDRIENTI